MHVAGHQDRVRRSRRDAVPEVRQPRGPTLTPSMVGAAHLLAHPPTSTPMHRLCCTVLEVGRPAPRSHESTGHIPATRRPWRSLPYTEDWMWTRKGMSGQAGVNKRPSYAPDHCRPGHSATQCIQLRCRGPRRLLRGATIRKAVAGHRAWRPLRPCRQPWRCKGAGQPEQATAWRLPAHRTGSGRRSRC